MIVKNKVLVGNSGGEMGVRGWLTALDLNSGKIAWRAYSTGPDTDVLIRAAVAAAPPSRYQVMTHMVQHELLMLIAAPLIALGRPDAASLGLFMHREQRKIAARCMRYLAVRPATAWILHGSAVGTWHLPSLYTAASLHPFVYLAQHISFLATALLAWWSVLGRRSDYGAAAFYVFATSMHTGLLELLLFIAPRPWYPTYATAHDALEDQQLARLIIWIPGGVIMAVTAMVLFAMWLKESDCRVFARERLALARSEARRVAPPVVIIFWVSISIAACSDPRPAAVALTLGNPDRGKESIRLYGCWVCHTIPGIHGANAVIGPPLNGIANRSYVAGHPNSPKHLVNWIRHPQQVRNRLRCPTWASRKKRLATLQPIFTRCVNSYCQS